MAYDRSVFCPIGIDKTKQLDHALVYMQNYPDSNIEFHSHSTEADCNNIVEAPHPDFCWFSDQLKGENDDQGKAKGKEDSSKYSKE